MERRSRNESFELIKRYSAGFIIFAVICVILFFLVEKKSMFTFADGTHQTYCYYLYTGKWLRRLFANLFIDHIYEIPMWDMTIGMGADPITTFSVGNTPGAWIYSFVPIGTSEYVFNVIIVIRLYLSGLMFALYAYGRKNSINSSVAGALVYAFSATVYVSFTQPSFAYLFYVFPMLLIGTDRIWNGKGYKFYVFSMMISVCFSYYFTYMMVILIVLYCIIRFASDKANRNRKRLFILLGKYIPFTLLGMGMGIAFQLPSMISLAGIDRLDSAPEVPLFSISGIKELILHCFSNGEVGHEGFWGISSVALLCIVVLFHERKKYTTIKLMLVLYTLSFAFPIVGSVFNGFSFPTGRYVFGYLMLVSYIVVLEFDRLGTLSRRDNIIIFVGSAVYMLVVFVLGDAIGMLSALSLIVMTLIVYVSDRFLVNDKRKITICRYAGVLLSCLIISFAHIHTYILAAEVDLGSANDIILGRSGTVALSEEQLDELTKTRMDYIPFSFDDSPSNSSMVLNVNSYDFYHSNYNNDIDHYYDRLGIISDPIGYRYTGLRGRNYLELMNASEYLVRDSNANGILAFPYSYESVSDEAGKQILVSDHEVSLVYFYDEVASYSALETLDPVEIEDLMMNVCLLDDGTKGTASSSGYSPVDYTIVESSGITQSDDNAFHADRGAYIILGFDEVKDSEISLYYEHINADAYYVITSSIGYGDEEFSYDFFSGKSPDDRYYHWKDDFVVNFGFFDKAVDHVRLVFNSEGNYTLDDIKLYSRSQEQLDNTVTAFYDHADMENISYEINGNHILITATADKDKYLYMAVPYSVGWSARIDGEPTEVMKANIGFMAIPISQGAHTVEFTYCTPFLKESICISGGFWGVFVLVCTYDKIQRRKSSTPKRPWHCV